ncbi:MAG: metallophosphoesterase [Gammaproteobacteria bacterium]|nr:metallophosphoesterase [Gammaproteobacteria bacterium]
MTHKVVQITDTHLFKVPGETQKGVDTHRTLQAVVADVVGRHADFDALLLTGDLSQDETPESYDLLERTLAPLRGAPFHAIPGNHDDLDAMGARLAAEDFHVLADVRLDGWRIAMLNSRVPGRVHGELGTEQIGALKASLAGAGEHVMVALHHPPVSIDSAWIDASRCLDGDDLLAVLDNPPVKAVVCGHVHQELAAERNGIAVLATPSTCVQFLPGSDEFAIDPAAPGYRVFELEEDGRWSTTVIRVAV